MGRSLSGHTRLFCHFTLGLGTSSFLAGKGCFSSPVYLAPGSTQVLYQVHYSVLQGKPGACCKLWKGKGQCSGEGAGRCGKVLAVQT